MMEAAKSEGKQKSQCNNMKLLCDLPSAVRRQKICLFMYSVIHLKVSIEKLIVMYLIFKGGEQCGARSNCS